MDTRSPEPPPEALQQRLCYYRRTRRLVRLLRAHPGKILTLESAASIAGMERTAFSRFFHEKIGMTFSEFHRVYRIHLAVERMRVSNVSVKELAHEVGFNCASTFVRNFKKEVGMSPTLFRACLHKEPQPVPHTLLDLLQEVAGNSTVAD